MENTASNRNIWRFNILLKKQWSINWRRRRLEISRAAYYKWLHRPVPEQEAENLKLAELIKEYDECFCRILGYRRNDNKLVFDTYDKAVEQNPESRPLFHSDRGYQYTSKVFQAKLQEQGMYQSMSRVGYCIDNGPTEGLWGIIKSEYCMYKITDEGSLCSAIHGYIKFYANERPQDRFHCKTPSEVRQETLASETAFSTRLLKING